MRGRNHLTKLLIGDTISTLAKLVQILRALKHEIMEDTKIREKDAPG